LAGVEGIAVERVGTAEAVDHPGLGMPRLWVPAVLRECHVGDGRAVGRTLRLQPRPLLSALRLSRRGSSRANPR
jgi:hypothetical protein